MELLCYIDFEIKQCQLYYVWPLRKKCGYDECYGVAEKQQQEVTLHDLTAGINLQQVLENQI